MLPFFLNYEIILSDKLYRYGLVEKEAEKTRPVTCEQWRGNVFWTGGLKIVRSCQRLGQSPPDPPFSNARF